MTDSREQPDRSGHAALEPITVDPPPPPAVAPLAVTLSDVTFLHWSYEPSVVRPLMPPGTEPDTFNGVAYVGLVADASGGRPEACSLLTSSRPHRAHALQDATRRHTR